jgi:hypothetical protein
MLKVAAEECDGVKLHGFCTRRYIEEAVMPRLAEGLAKAGRQRENYEISGGGFLATGPDDATVARMFEWVRERVAFYGSTQAYWPVFAVHGLEDLGHTLNAMTRQGKWSEMAKEVPDDVVHLFAAVGRYDQIVKAITKRFGGLTDALNARHCDAAGPPAARSDPRHPPHPPRLPRVPARTSLDDATDPQLSQSNFSADFSMVEEVERRAFAEPFELRGAEGVVEP